MSMVTRRVIIDTDTGEREVREHFKLGVPCTQKDVDALIAFLNRKSTPGRLETANEKIAELLHLKGYEKLPEYLGAVQAIEECCAQCAKKNWDAADLALKDFAINYERGMRRVALRAPLVHRAAGGKRSGQKRNRDASVYHHYQYNILKGKSHLQAIADCERMFQYKGPSQIRKIIARMEKHA